jgi:hypothetical protein
MVSRASIRQQVMKASKKRKPKLGTGKRFKALTSKLSKKGAKNPKALAAWIGRKKYGKKKMAKIAAKGRKRKV